MGEPLFLGIVIGCGIGALGCGSWKEVLKYTPENIFKEDSNWYPYK